MGKRHRILPTPPIVGEQARKLLADMEAINRDEIDPERKRLFARSSERASKYLKSIGISLESVSVNETLAKAEDALLEALPFVEDDLKDPGYKKGAVAKSVKKIRDALDLIERYRSRANL